MSEVNIYRFIDYKSYLSALEQVQNQRGFRSRLAEATDCQNAFISQVFNGLVNFNLEQALKISHFLRLKNEEKQYFLWMIEYARAGTTDLKNYFHQLMSDLKEKHLNIKERVQIAETLSEEAQTIYYSHWIYSAVHIASMIPKLNTVEKLTHAFDFEKEKMSDVIEFLVRHGLVEQKGSQISSGKTQIHLSQNSPNIFKHHTNWRIESIKSLDHNHRTDLHYSGISSLSKADVDKIRAIFVDTIENYIRTIEKSPEETLYCFNLDFFKTIKE